MEVKNLLNDDLLKRIYYGDVYFSQESPNTAEYKNVLQKMKSLSNKIRSEREVECYFEEYCEISAIKESLETELHFELGFKTAVRLIMYGLQEEKGLNY